jgi:hypothetical protein
MTATEQTPAQQMAEALNQRARRLRENRHLWTDTRIAGTWASGKVAIVDAAALEAVRRELPTPPNSDLACQVVALLESAQTAGESHE